MFSSELFHLKFLGPLTSRLQILCEDGEGMLDTNVIVLDLDPASEGVFVLGLGFGKAGPGFDSTYDLELDDDDALTN